MEDLKAQAVTNTTASLQVLATGSSGNGYILRCGADVLLLECGVSLERTLQALDYDISNVAGVLVTHKHGDHAKYATEYDKYLKTYGNIGVAGFRVLENKRRYKIGNFDVIPLEVPHGDCLCSAYYIHHLAMGWLLFCTDAERFSYKLKPLPDNIIIECNYIQDVVLEHLSKGEEVRSNYGSHMELSDTIDAVTRLWSERLRNVVLIHRSKGNFNATTAKNEFMRWAEIMPIVAKIGDVIGLGECDY